MFRQLLRLGDFVRQLKVQARFGDLSRLPLRLLRVEVCGEHAECDWVARPADAWDSNLPSSVGDRNASLQALRDAISVRELLFRVLPELHSAAFRVYRKTASEYFDLVITGVVTRGERLPKDVNSLAMRAKLLDLRFRMDEGVLENLQPEVWAASS